MSKTMRKKDENVPPPAKPMTESQKSGATVM